MVYGYCTGFSTNPRFMLGTELLEKIRRTGFDFVEFPLMNFYYMTDDAFSDLVKLVDKNSLRGPSACNFFPGSVRLVGKEVNPGKIMEYLDNVLPRCKALGIDKIILGSGPARTFGKDQTPEEAKNQFEGLLKEVILPRTKALGITVCIEPFERNYCNLIVSILEGLEVVKDVDDYGLMLMVDLYHMLSNGESLMSLETAFPYIRHVHVAGPGRRVPQDSDTFIWDALKTLKNLGYDGSVSFETEDAPEQVLVSALEKTKRYIGKE